MILLSQFLYKLGNLREVVYLRSVELYRVEARVKPVLSTTEVYVDSGSSHNSAFSILENWRDHLLQGSSREGNGNPPSILVLREPTGESLSVAIARRGSQKSLLLTEHSLHFTLVQGSTPNVEQVHGFQQPPIPLGQWLTCFRINNLSQ